MEAHARAGAIDLATAPVFRLGTLRVEPSLRRITAPDGACRQVEPKVMQVLLVLYRAEGRTLSRRSLSELCWQGRIISDDAIDRVIARIRRVGEALAPQAFTLETLPKVGYRLVISEGSHDGVGSEASGPTRWSVPHRRAIVAGIGLTVAAAAGAIFVARKPASNRAAPGTDISLAVLPFDARSPSVADTASRLSDLMRADLGRVEGLRIVAETSPISSEASRGSVRTAKASLLLQGSVIQTTQGVEVSASLADGMQNRHLWTVVARAAEMDVDALRQELSGQILQQIAGLVPASGAHRRGAVTRPDPEAYALVADANRLLEEVRTDQMRGRAGEALDKGEQALVLANRALRIDSGYADALIVLAGLTRNGWTRELAAAPLTTQQRVENSLVLVRQALISDPNSPRALTMLGDYYRRFAFRWAEAETVFQRALAADPGLVDAHWSYGYLLGTTGQSLAGLSHAVTTFELAPQAPFRRLALPRLLYTSGDRPSALARYQVELREQPDNLFLLRELYLMFLAEGGLEDLVGLRDHVAALTLRPSTAHSFALLRDRISAACEALGGRPDRLRGLVDAEVRAFGLDGANATPQGRARDDLPYIFALEYAWSGATDAAIRMLDRALTGKSLYWPATLPFGSAPFPWAVRRDPRFDRLWSRDPGLAELLRRRRAAIEAGQMHGYGADGRAIRPNIDSALKQRVATAMRRP